MSSPTSHSLILKLLPSHVAPDRVEGAVNRLILLVEAAADFSAFAHEYDYSSSVPANGFRSFVKILTLYIQNLSLTMDPSAEKNPKRRSRSFSDYLHLLPFLTKQVELMRMIRRKDLEMNCNQMADDTSVTEVGINQTEMEILLRLLEVEDSDVMPLFSSVRNFWLTPDTRRIMDIFLNHILAKTMSLHQILMLAFDSNVRMKAGARYSLSATMHELKMAWSLTDRGLGRAITSLRFLSSSGRVEWVQLRRDPMADVVLPRSTASSQDPVSAMLVSYADKACAKSKTLIFHCAGGGYVATTPRAHESYLRCWSKHSQVPILCPDYGKAPEKPFPEGLCDLLHSYLFVCSRENEVLRMLGFYPDEIVLTGESAGGNLALALILLLLQLKKECTTILLPKSVFFVYPAANASVHTSPSRSFVTFDPILTVAATFGIGAAYPGLAPDPQSEPWFRKPVPQVVKLLTRIAQASNNHLLNPLLSPELGRLHDIPLFIQMCEFDPLLDDSIAIAKAWGGAVDLHLAEGMPHGYLASTGQRFVTEALHLSLEILSRSLAPNSSQA